MVATVLSSDGTRCTKGGSDRTNKSDWKYTEGTLAVKPSYDSARIEKRCRRRGINGLMRYETAAVVYYQRWEGARWVARALKTFGIWRAALSEPKKEHLNPDGFPRDNSC